MHSQTLRFQNHDHEGPSENVFDCFLPSAFGARSCIRSIVMYYRVPIKSIEFTTVIFIMGFVAKIDSVDYW